MSSKLGIRNYKKSDLVELAELLEVSSAGNKSDLESRIRDVVDSDPTRLKDLDGTRFAVKSGKKPVVVAEIDEVAVVAEPEEELEEDEEEEEEEEEEPAAEEEEEEDDDETGPSIKERLLDHYLSAKETTSEYLEIAQDQIEFHISYARYILTTTWIAAFVGIGLEFFLIVHGQLPEASVFKIQSSFFEKYDVLLNYRLFWEPIIVYSAWTVGVPLLISFFTNFIVYDDPFDPLVFYGARGLVVYVLFQSKLNNLPLPSDIIYSLDRIFGLARLLVGDLPYFVSAIGSVLSIYAAATALPYYDDEDDDLEDFEFEEELVEDDDEEDEEE